MFSALSTWIATQRWFKQHQNQPELQLHAAQMYAHGDIQLHWLLISDMAVNPYPIYQVPLLHGTTTLLTDAEPGALIFEPDSTADNETETSEIPAVVLDATRHPLGRKLILQALFNSSELVKKASNTASHSLELIGDSSLGSTYYNSPTQLLAGEQSNSSIIVYAPETPVIVKLFRVLSNGENPDVAVHAALNRLGSSQIAQFYGASRINAPHLQTHAGFAVSFFSGVEDAWREALQAARTGIDFTDAAYRLGETSAQMHAELADAFPTHRPSTAEVAARVHEMRENLDKSVQIIPELAAFAPRLTAVFDAAAASEWGIWQRVHGDYHLGQVLDTPERGFIVLDFEGEPLRNLKERIRLEPVWKDVAGMLRSLDYVAGALKMEAKLDVSRWVRDTRAAFMSGYLEHAKTSTALNQAVLLAFEVDKALYEARYEAAQRPSWLGIPVQALKQLSQHDPLAPGEW